MKKIYFLISIFIFIAPGIITSSYLKQQNSTNIQSSININSKNYLTLSYQDGKFFSWNQSNDTSEHNTGIFTSSDNKSYLLSNTGVFTNLNVVITNLVRIDDTRAIAQLNFYKDNNDIEYFNKNFIVQLDSNGIFSIISQQPINTINNNFTILNNDYLVSYGIGVDLIKISDSSVTNLVAPYKDGYYKTYFYRLTDDSGIFINGDQNYHFLDKINTSVEDSALGVSAPSNFNNNVIAINDTTFVLRNDNKELLCFDISQGIPGSFTNLNIKSWADNFCFKINEQAFIVNTSNDNYSTSFGRPFLIKTSDLTNLLPLTDQKTLLNITFNTSSTGVFIDGGLLGYNFTVDSNDNFTFTKIGSLNSYQTINDNLGYATFENNNLLLSKVDNNAWAVQKSIVISPISNKNATIINFLNNMIPNSSNLTDYRNSYFANNLISLNIEEKTLTRVEIFSSQGNQVLTPDVNNSINYNFDKFLKYKVTIFFTNYSFKYQVTIDSFTENNLVTINGDSAVSYVGYADNQVYDVQTINENSFFTVTAFNYSYIQNIDLIRYSTGLIVKSITSLKENDSIRPQSIELQYLCSIKIENLLNQVSMVYLGFTHNGQKPMIPFWDTDQGKNLRKEALSRGYTATQLDKMNSSDINKLLQLANTWNLFKVQATTLAYIIIVFMSIAVVIIGGSYGYNSYLDKKIKRQTTNEVLLIK